MANEYFVNSADLTSVADAIRAKGETTAQLVFPGDFVTAIENIKGSIDIPYPSFDYDGNYASEQNADTGDWKIRFLSSGTFVSDNDIYVDVFAVGAGGGGSGSTSALEGSGGGGGYTTTIRNVYVKAGEPYDIIVGAGGSKGSSSNPSSAGNGGNSSGFSVAAEGGKGGYGSSGSSGRGGNGGSGGGSWGGDGGTDGSDGVGISNQYGSGTGGKGQGTTTREFGEADGTLYSKGGKGSIAANITNVVDNSGNGGHGRSAAAKTSGDKGSSGIVIIRNARGAS